MYDLALFKLKLSTFGSPFQVFVSEVAPALSADWEFFSFEQNVQFNIFALAGMLPRVLTPFQTNSTPRS